MKNSYLNNFMIQPQKVYNNTSVFNNNNHIINLRTFSTSQNHSLKQLPEFVISKKRSSVQNRYL